MENLPPLLDDQNQSPNSWATGLLVSSTGFRGPEKEAIQSLVHAAGGMWAH